MSLAGILVKRGNFTILLSMQAQIPTAERQTTQLLITNYLTLLPGIARASDHWTVSVYFVRWEYLECTQKYFLLPFCHFFVKLYSADGVETGVVKHVVASIQWYLWITDTLEEWPLALVERSSSYRRSLSCFFFYFKTILWINSYELVIVYDSITCSPVECCFNLKFSKWL